jgi:hypothetical protein
VKTYQEVGDFDEGYAIAYMEDSDYAYRLKLENKKVKADIFFNPEVYRNSQTIAKDSKLNTHFPKNQQRYIDKWGGGIGNETFKIPFNGGEGYDIQW